MEMPTAGTSHAAGEPFLTLPDYLAPDLWLVFIGINPGIYSAQRGHYFARATNRFWPAFSRSRLSEGVRASLGRDRLQPEDDAWLLESGIGFTDVVKRATPNASALTPADFERWVPRLLENLAVYQPKVACFQGVTGYRAFLRYALNIQDTGSVLGPQGKTIGTTRTFVVPSPSPANAHFRMEDLVAWYDRLADFLEEIASTRPG